VSTAYEQAVDRARAYRKDRDFAEFENLFCEDIGLASTQAMWDWVERYADRKSAEAQLDSLLALTALTLLYRCK